METKPFLGTRKGLSIFGIYMMGNTFIASEAIKVGSMLLPYHQMDVMCYREAKMAL
jgi:hypothetical protein